MPAGKLIGELSRDTARCLPSATGFNKRYFLILSVAFLSVLVQPPASPRQDMYECYNLFGVQESTLSHPCIWVCKSVDIIRACQKLGYLPSNQGISTKIYTDLMKRWIFLDFGGFLGSPSLVTAAALAFFTHWNCLGTWRGLQVCPGVSQRLLWREER